MSESNNTNIIRINVTVDVSNPSQREAMDLFLNSLVTSVKSVADSAGASAEPKKEAKKEPVKTVAKKPAEKVVPLSEIAEEEESEKADITLQQLKNRVREVMGDHLQAIKAQLSKLGANNVSTLDEKHYSSFMDFLNKLDPEF